MQNCLQAFVCLLIYAKPLYKPLNTEKKPESNNVFHSFVSSFLLNLPLLKIAAGTVCYLFLRLEP